MITHRRLPYVGSPGLMAIGAVCMALTGMSSPAQAAAYMNLPVVKPVMTCEQLAQAKLSPVEGASISVKSTSVRATEKGPYCRVVADVAPNIHFAGDLPIERWTQRFLLGAQGREGIQRAGTCLPALNGEIAVATQNGGGQGGVMAPGPWGIGPQERINSAYLGEHLTAVAMKELIKTFYGKPAKFSYMMGCSGGGAQTMIEAQRYPADFDGYSIGAPPIYDTVHNIGFWHGWEYHVNQRADGSIILNKDKLDILHDAAIAHCSNVSGIVDGGLQHPYACTFNKSWVQCVANASDTSRCLSAEEANVAEQLYLGPNDGRNFFEISGWPLGSEMLWRLSAQGKPADGEGLNPNGVHRLLMPPLSGLSTKDIVSQMTYSQEWFDKTLEMAPMWNVANTNLRPLAKSGGKILLWNGAEDTVVQPTVTISYYQGVQKEMGVRETDKIMRFFMIPGLGHCGMGDGANQIDFLSPLMAWVEMNQAPKVLAAGRPVPSTGGQGGGGFGQQAPGAVPNYPPYADADQKTIYTRPVFPFPMMAQYSGKGDPNDAASYVAVRGPLQLPMVFTNETSKLIGPNNQKFYRAEGDKLLVIEK